MWDDEVSKFEGRQEWVGESSNVLVSKTQKESRGSRRACLLVLLNYQFS